MTRVVRAACLFVSLATAITACAGRNGGSVTPPTSMTPPGAASAIAKTVAATGSDSASVSTTGGATCTQVNDLFIGCAGPAGSSATLTFTVTKGPLGYPPVSCGDVTWSTRKLFDRGRSPRSHLRAPRQLGGQYTCGTATGSVTAVAPAAFGYSTAVEASGQFEVCFDLPVNPCAETGTAGGTVAITNDVRGSGAPSPGPTPIPPGGGGGECSSAIARPPLTEARRPATGVIGGGGSPTPVPAGSPTPTATPSPAPPCATPTPPDRNTIELLTRDYPSGAPQYAYETSYDGSETSVIGTASSQRRPDRVRSAQAAGGCVGTNTADGRVDGHIYLSSVVQCAGSIAASSVTYFVFDKDPNAPSSYRTFTRFTLPCGGGSTCRTGRGDYPVRHTQVAKIVTYFETAIGRSTDGELTMPYNERGVLYPISYPLGYGGKTAEEVPWPSPPFFPCSTKLPANPNCSGTDLSFRVNVLQYYARNGWPVPGAAGGEPGVWQAHHIKPRSWGGGNGVENGVILSLPDHLRFTNWWRSFVQDGVRVPVQGGD